MMFRKPSSPLRLRPALRSDIRVGEGSSPIADGGSRHQHSEWRVTARTLARQLTPALVLATAAALGLAAVAIA